MFKNSKLNIEDIGSLIVLTAILFGGVFRFFPTLTAGFPVNDGGMFYVMMNDLKSNHYIPPLYTTYNNLNIPFAYPPFALYVGAVLSGLLQVSTIEILRWLPALVNTLCIPAFYFLAKEIIGDKFKGAVATLVFALTPHLTTWLSAGGGLTRSFGTMFMMLTVLFSYKLFAQNNTKAIWGASIFGALTVLSHTESTVFAIGLPIYIWLTKSRSLKGALQGGLVALGVLLVAGPWYLVVISRLGVDPLLSALKTGGQAIGSVLLLINVNFMTEEPYLGIFGVFGILGMIFLIIDRKYFLPFMLLTIYLIEPRSAPTIGNIPLAMAAGLFITEILAPAIKKNEVTNSQIYGRGVKIFLIFIIPYILFNSMYQGFMLSENHVSISARATMQWVKENTPQSSKFLVLTGEPEAMCESTAEWFPALTGRTSVSTLQGREWLIGSRFGEFISHRASLQSCIKEDIECLNREKKYFAEDFDYIYIAIKTPTNNCKPMDISQQTTQSIIMALAGSSHYTIVHQTSDDIIFIKK